MRNAHLIPIRSIPLTLMDNQVLGQQFQVGFKNFETSFVTLFRISTGEDWYKIMFDTTRESYSDQGQFMQYDCKTSCGSSNLLRKNFRFKAY